MPRGYEQEDFTTPHLRGIDSRALYLWFRWVWIGYQNLEAKRERSLKLEAKRLKVEIDSAQRAESVSAIVDNEDFADTWQGGAAASGFASISDCFILPVNPAGNWFLRSTCPVSWRNRL